MTKPFEAEARFVVREDFLKKLREMGFNIVLEYSFKDIFYRPKGGWREKGKLLRVREWNDGRCEVLFTNVSIIGGEVKFKRSKYKEGKVKLYEGMGNECRALIEDLEFEECGTIVKEVGYLMRKDWIDVALERVNGVWLLEIEVEGNSIDEAKDKMKKIMELLGLKNPIPKPVAEIFGVEC